MNELIMTVAVGAGATFFASLITWFFARRKTNADAKGAELDNVNKAVAIWREMAEALEKRLDEANIESQKSREENENLRLEVSEIKRQVKILLCENQKLKNMVNKITERKNNKQ